MRAGDRIFFREGDELLELWVEAELVETPHVVGWCPQLHKSMVVALANVTTATATERTKL